MYVRRLEFKVLRIYRRICLSLRQVRDGKQRPHSWAADDNPASSASIIATSHLHTALFFDFPFTSRALPKAIKVFRLAQSAAAELIDWIANYGLHVMFTSRRL